MTKKRAKRKLAAILSADVKGYSRLMADDEEATVRTINAYREMITNLIEADNGKVVDAKGDNILAEFPSVVDAVRCASEVQNQLKERNAELPEHRRMEFRVGINLGDVIEEGGVIYGDGVNIAARLEALAEGGGICASGTAFDQVEGKLELEFEYLGEQAVKNIKKPVRVYRVKMEGGVIDAEIRQELPLPDKPSIAVLPFVNMSGDPEQEYFSDGISEDIITALSKTPKLFVIARNSSFTYKGKSVWIPTVGKELGVKYILEGSVRRAGDKLRITAQLIEAATNKHLWAEKYDRNLKDIFALQDEITMKIITELQVKLTSGEQARLSGKGTDNLEAYLKYLKSHEYFVRMNKEDNALARRMAEQAIALDPEYPSGYSLLGWTHFMDVWYGTSKSSEQSMATAFELAQKALTLDKSLIEPHNLLGAIYLTKRQHEKALAEAEEALALEPNSADEHMHLGRILCYGGRPKEVIPLLKKALRLSPIPEATTLYMLVFAYNMTGQYEKAIVTGKKAIVVEPENLWCHMTLTIAYSLAGRDEEARVQAKEMLRINPKFSVDHYDKTAPFRKETDRELIMTALRKAGLK